MASETSSDNKSKQILPITDRRGYNTVMNIFKTTTARNSWGWTKGEIATVISVAIAVATATQF